MGIFLTSRARDAMESTLCNTPSHASRDATGYLPVENYGLIGNMHTCALAAMDGSIGRSLSS